MRCNRKRQVDTTPLVDVVVYIPSREFTHGKVSNSVINIAWDKVRWVVIEAIDNILRKRGDYEM